MNWLFLGYARSLRLQLASHSRRCARLGVETLESRSLLASVAGEVAAGGSDSESVPTVTAITALQESGTFDSNLRVFANRHRGTRDVDSGVARRQLTRGGAQALAVVALRASKDATSISSSRGDIDGDGIVSRRDIAILARNFGRTTDVTLADGDLNSDGKVDLLDLAQVRIAWGVFEVTSPQSISLAPSIEWTTSAVAASYVVSIERQGICDGESAVRQITGLTEPHVVVDGLPDGIYYACVYAVNEQGLMIGASNNGLRFHVGPEELGVISNTAGLLAWWDVGYGITVDANSRVEAWLDRSGNGNDLRQQSAANRPLLDESHILLNHRPAITFEKAASEFLSVEDAPLAQALSGEDRPYEVCVVYRRDVRPSVDGTYEAMFGITDTSSYSNYIGMQQVVSSGYMRDHNTRRDAAGATASAWTRQEIVGLGPSIRCDASSGTRLAGYAVGYSQNIDNDMRTDIRGDAAQNVGNMSMHTVSVGSLLRIVNANYFDGAIAEIVVFDRRLDDAERVPMLAYLKDKYFPAFANALEIPDLAHHWDASAIDLGLGEKVSMWYDAAGAKHFAAFGDAQPTLQAGPNGRTVLELDGIDDAMIAGLPEDWTKLHDGSGFTAFMLYRVADFDRDALEPLLDTVSNDANANAGFGLYYDNRMSLGRNRRIDMLVGAATPVAVLNSTTANDAVRPQEWEVAAIRHEASTPRLDTHYVLFADNQPVASAGVGTLGYSTDAPNFSLSLGRLAGTETFAKIQVGEILIFDRTLSNYETQKVHEYLARKWNYAHVAVAGGNGQAYLNNDGYHRGFPASVIDTDGTIHFFYRRAADHGHSSGVTVEVTTKDGVTFSPERVIYASPGYDIRVEGPATRLMNGPYAGRLLVAHNRSGPQSQLLPATVELLYSDDNGETWGVVQVTAGDTEYDDWDGSAHTIFELNDGTVMLLYAGDKSTERRPNLLKRTSGDGGLTWTAAVSIYNGAPDGVRAIEPNVIRRSDGSLFLLFRDDTNQRILSMRSTDEGQTWSAPEFAFDGWATPRMIFDEHGRLYVFYRGKQGTANSFRMVWRYSDDEGETWEKERRFEHTAFTGMTYSQPITDAIGNIWIVYGLERGVDSDIFFRLWHTAA